MQDEAAYETEEMTLRDYAAVIKRRKWFVIVPTVLVTVAAVVWSLLQTPMYRASTDVLVKEPPVATAVGAPERPMQQRVLQNELQRAQGSTLQDEVRAEIGPEPDISVRLAATDQSDVFIFTGESESPTRAAEAATAYADAYIESRRELLSADLEARIAVVQQRVDELASNDDPAGGTDPNSQLADYRFELEALETSVLLAQESGAAVIDVAQVPTSPFEPTPLRSAVLALVVGLLIGLGAAFLADYLDQRLRDEDDLARAARVPVLGVIPRVPNWKSIETHVITLEDATSPPAEAYRALRTSVQFLGVDRSLKIVQITSPKPGDGKSTTAANLAVACARTGQRVVLLDGDLRRPRLHHFFELPNDYGFTSALVHAMPADIVQKVDGEPNLLVITSGPLPPDPSEMLSSPRTRKFITGLAEHSDLVIVDSPPVLVVSDALVLSAVADGVILVATAKQTDRREVERAVEQLSQIEASVIGAVLNGYSAGGASQYEYRYEYGQYEAKRT